MLIKKIVIAVFFTVAVAGVKGQTTFNKHVSWWPAYYLKYSINNKWAVNTDIQVRNFANEPLVGLIAMRSGANYNINKQWSVAIGGAWFHQQGLTNAKKREVTDELRLWEEMKHDLKINKWQITNQVRTEQRHWINYKGTGFRFRYRLAAEYAISKNWKAIAGNELMWQSYTTRKNWDQYRVWLGGEYAFNKKKQVQLLLMNWWQFSKHTSQPAVRINFVQSIMQRYE